MFYDKVCELSTTVGTTAYLLGGAPAGSAQRTWQSQAPNGSRAFYYAQAKDGSKWELGYGILTYGSPAQLTRILLASSSGSLISWTSGDVTDGYIVFSAPVALVWAATILGQGFAARPAWAPQGLPWLDVSAGWNTRVKDLIYNGTVDVERGRYEGVPGIYVPSPRRYWVDHGAAAYAATTDDIGKVHLFNVAAADRAFTLPAGSGVDHGFSQRALGYGSSGHNVVLTPNGSDTIDQGSGGAALAIPGNVPFTVEWDGAKAQWRTNYVPAQAVNYFNASGFVNVLRNGSFIAWPNGASGSIATAPTGAAAVAASGWAVLPTGAGITWARAATGANGAPKGLTITGAASVTGIKVAQRLESTDMAPFAGKTATFQIAVTNNTGGSLTPTLQTRYAGTTDNWTSPVVDLASPSLQACPNGQTTVVSYSFAVHANAGNGYELQIDFGNNFFSGAKSVTISGADLRVTAGATIGLQASPPPPEYRDSGAELDRCARFFQASYDNAVAPGAADRNGLINVGNNGTGPTNGIGFSFPVRMRAAPTLSFWDGAGGAGKASKYQSGSWTDNAGTLATVTIGQSGTVMTSTDTTGVVNFAHYTGYADFW